MGKIAIGRMTRSMVIGGDVTQSTVVNASRVPDPIFTQLRLALHTIEDKPHQRTLLDALQDLQNSAGHPSFLPEYQRFIQLAANHMTLIAPFIPALSALIGM